MFRFAFALLLIAVSGVAARADDLPGRNWISMQRVIQDLGRAGYGPIAKAEAEDGTWQIRAYRGATLYDIKVDPRSGAVREAKPMTAPSCGCPRSTAAKPADKASYSPARRRAAHPRHDGSLRPAWTSTSPWRRLR